MMKSLLIPLAIVFAAVALALYAMPRRYQDFSPVKSADATASTSPTRSTARITGRVAWQGASSQEIMVEGMMGRNGAPPKWDKVPNPAAPQIHPGNRGIANAVVYLKQVGPERKPWPYPPVTVEMRGDAIRVLEANVPTVIGLIPLGGEVEMISSDPHYHMLRARGAAFFTLPFPKGTETQKKTFDQAGYVAFTNATGEFWFRADAFICEHPYYTRSDSNGAFEMDHVPTGDYEIVAWLKNWTILSKERDPETGKIVRLNFDEPLTTTSRVKVVEGQTANVELKLP